MSEARFPPRVCGCASACVCMCVCVFSSFGQEKTQQCPARYPKEECHTVHVHVAPQGVGHTTQPPETAFSYTKPGDVRPRGVVYITRGCYVHGLGGMPSHLRYTIIHTATFRFLQATAG